MRTTIQRQFLAPMLLTVLGAVTVSSLLTAWWFALQVERHAREHLDRIVATLTAPGFPLTEAVLNKMSGLSGAEFIVVDATGARVVSTASAPSLDHAALEIVPAPAQGTIIRLGDEEYLVERLPIVSSESAASPRELIVLSPQGTWRNAQVRALVPPLLIGGGAALLLAVVVTIRARRVVRPIRQLRQQAEAVARGVFKTIPLPEREDEVHDLSRAINAMVARLAGYEQQVRRQERMETLGRLAGGMSHQVRNAATGAKLALELHERECPSAVHSDDLAVARRQLELIENYLQRLLAVGRRQPEGVEPLRQRLKVAVLVRDAAALIEPLCHHVRVELHVAAIDPALEIDGSRTDLEQALVNLLLNSVEAVRTLDTQRRITVSALREAADTVVIRVADSGAGPAADVSDALFEPFVSNKPDGVGLGLAMTRAVASGHGGRVNWRRDGTETVFEILLPLVESEVPDGAVAGGR